MKAVTFANLALKMIDLNRAGDWQIITKKKWSQISKIIYTKTLQCSE